MTVLRQYNSSTGGWDIIAQGVQGYQGNQGNQGNQGTQGSSGNSFSQYTSTSSTSYSLASADLGSLITSTSAAAVTLTITNDTTLSLSTTYGQIVEIIQTGSGQVSFAQGSGVTIQSIGSTSTAPKLRTQYSSASLVRTAANTWVIIGDII